MNKIILCSFVVSIFIGCASRKYGDQIVDTHIESKGNVTNEGKLGFDKDRNLVLEKKTRGDKELESQITLNEKIKDDVNQEAYLFNWCRKDIADPRLNGNGELPEPYEFQSLKGNPEYSENFGMTEQGELIFVKRKSFKETLEYERKLQVALESELKTLQKKRESCEFKMGGLRVKAGLPFNRYPGKSHFEGSTFIVEQKRENNLDDAFEILKGESK